jgi:hypothetical protein
MQPARVCADPPFVNHTPLHEEIVLPLFSQRTLPLPAVSLIEQHEGGFALQRGPVPVDVKLIVNIPVDRVDEIAAHGGLCFSNFDAVAQDEGDQSKHKRRRHNQPQRLRPI